METINELNVTEKSMIEINNLCFGEVTLFCNEHCLHIYNSRSWIGMISLKDIKKFESNDSEIDSEVNKFILEQSYK